MVRPENFVMSIGNHIGLEVSFKAEFEYEVDGVIEVLKIAQTILRMYSEPLPRNRSLVPT